jgi:hypothetical protein
VRIGGREAVLGSSGEPRRRAPPGAAVGQPLPRQPLLHATRAVRSARTTQIKRRRTPLIGPPWTGGPGPRARSTACVSSASALASAQPTAARHVAPPQLTRRPPWQVCK